MPDSGTHPSLLARTSLRGGPDLIIGLINNMPAAAKRATEEQFNRLLTAASQSLDLRIAFFTVDQFGAEVEETFRLLREVQPDGLIVTGDEPQSAAIGTEPIYPALARLVDWAAENTVSSVWSCLAAHAAAFRLDRIERRRQLQKLSGMFMCAAAADHPLLAEFPSRWLVPHSRHNNVDESELRAKGYTILSHAPRVGADSFVKPAGTSQFVFMQGHPEYAPDSLFREYRRDIRRYLAGKRETYPDMPENYFDRKTAETLAALREEARRSPSARLLASVYAAYTVAPAPARSLVATQLYANWLADMAKRKTVRATAEPQRGAA